MNKKQIIGIIIFFLIIVGVVLYKFLSNGGEGNIFDTRDLTTIYVATGGGKEDFIADEEVNKILRKKYKINVVYDSWSMVKQLLFH